MPTTAPTILIQYHLLHTTQEADLRQTVGDRPADPVNLFSNNGSHNTNPIPPFAYNPQSGSPPNGGRLPGRPGELVCQQRSTDKTFPFNTKQMQRQVTAVILSVKKCKNCARRCSDKAFQHMLRQDLALGLRIKKCKTCARRCGDKAF